jgi:hypothetical protein
MTPSITYLHILQRELVSIQFKNNCMFFYFPHLIPLDDMSTSKQCVCIILSNNRVHTFTYVYCKENYLQCDLEAITCFSLFHTLHKKMTCIDTLSSPRRGFTPLWMSSLLIWPCKPFILNIIYPWFCNFRGN